MFSLIFSFLSSETFTIDYDKEYLKFHIPKTI